MSAAPSHNQIVAEMNRIQEAIDKLIREQAIAQQAAVYVGMSKEETKAYDARGREIARLIQRLDQLKHSL